MVSGALMSLSYWDMFAAVLISLCFGLLSKFSALTLLSSFLCSLKSGILAFGITVNGAKLSCAILLTALGLPRVLLASEIVWVINGFF